MTAKGFGRFAAFIRLVCLSAKSHFGSLAAMALGAAIAPLLAAAVFAAAGPTLAGAFAQVKLELIFCDLEGSSYFDTLLNLLLADESITKTVSVRKLDYADALAELAEGRADAVVAFPESFLSDMAAGINRPIRIYGNESDPVKTVFIREFMQSAAAELSAAQSAINNVWFHMDLESMNGFRRNMVFTSLTLEYTSKAFARSVYYTFRNVSPLYEGSSPAAYVTASVLAALVFFGAISGIRLVMAERRAGVAARLAASGVTGVRAALYHFAPIYLKQLICACLAVTLALPAVTAADAISRRGSDASAYSSGPSSRAEDAKGDAGGGAILGGIIKGSLNPAADSAADEAGVESDIDSSSGDPSDIGDPANASLSLYEILNMTATEENASRLADAIAAMCLLCLFTSAVSLFLGYMFRRPESAEAFIVTLGVAMAIAGGTIIPYPYMPDIMKSFGPFCFNSWAQRAIASALFGGVAVDSTRILAVFFALAALLFYAAIVKIKAERT